MKHSLRASRVPILLLQAENDYDVGPSKTPSAEMKSAGKPYEVKIYPPFGETKQEGHSFGYYGNSIWGKDVFAELDMTELRGPNLLDPPSACASGPCGCATTFRSTARERDQQGTTL